MTTIEVRMATGKYRTIEFHKKFEDITASEIMARINSCIWGWKDITVANPLKGNIKSYDRAYRSKTDYKDRNR